MTTGVAYDALYGSQAEITAAKAKHSNLLAWNCYITDTTSVQPSLAHANGLGSIATYERAANELVGLSRNGGQAVGKLILADLKSRGFPGDGFTAVYPSADVQVATSQITSCDQGLLGIKDVIGSEGYSLREYAEGALLEHVYNEGIVAGPGWLSGSKSFPGWQAAAVAPYVCMIQVVGSDVGSTDRDNITDAERLGAWWPTGSPFTPGDEMLDATDPIVKELLAGIAAVPGKVVAQPIQVLDPVTGKVDGTASLSALVAAVNKHVNAEASVLAAIQAELASGNASTLTVAELAAKLKIEPA